MTHTFWAFFTASSFLALSWECAAPARADDSDTIDLAEVTRRVAQWRASFVNLHAVWELRSLPETAEAVTDWPPPPDPKAGTLFSREEWTWADHGLDRFEDWTFFYKDGRSKVHSIEAFNGPKGVVFRASFQTPPDGTEHFDNLLLRGLGTGKPTSHIQRAATEGLFWPAYATWLPEMLSKWEWKLETIEDVAGEPCARIETVRRDAGDVDVVETFWLDLNHNCLVRRRRRPAIPKRRLGGDFIVDEFQRLDGDIWFPKRGRSQLGGAPHENHLFVVTEAAVNLSLDLSRFDPPAPSVGTIVDDGQGRVYRHGVSASQSSPPAKTGTASGPTVPTTEPTFSAVPPRPTWWSWSAALASFSTVLAGLGFWFWCRKQENPS